MTDTPDPTHVCVSREAITDMSNQLQRMASVLTDIVGAISIYRSGIDYWLTLDVTPPPDTQSEPASE